MEHYNEHNITRHYNGKIRTEQFSLNGKYHNSNGPSFIRYYESGEVQIKCYELNDKLHRLEGPAVINYDINGNIEYESYYLFCIQISKKDFYTPGFIDAFILENS